MKKIVLGVGLLFFGMSFSFGQSCEYNVSVNEAFFDLEGEKGDYRNTYYAPISLNNPNGKKIESFDAKVLSSHDGQIRVGANGTVGLTMPDELEPYKQTIHKGGATGFFIEFSTKDDIDPSDLRIELSNFNGECGLLVIDRFKLRPDSSIYVDIKDTQVTRDTDSDVVTVAGKFENRTNRALDLNSMSLRFNTDNIEPQIGNMSLQIDNIDVPIGRTFISSQAEKIYGNVNINDLDTTIAPLSTISFTLTFDAYTSFADKVLDTISIHTHDQIGMQFNDYTKLFNEGFYVSYKEANYTFVVTGRVTDDTSLVHSIEVSKKKLSDEVFGTSSNLLLATDKPRSLFHPLDGGSYIVKFQPLGINGEKVGKAEYVAYTAGEDVNQMSTKVITSNPNSLWSVDASQPLSVETILANPDMVQFRTPILTYNGVDVGKVHVYVSEDPLLQNVEPILVTPRRSDDYKSHIIKYMGMRGLKENTTYYAKIVLMEGNDQSTESSVSSEILSFETGSDLFDYTVSGDTVTFTRDDLITENDTIYMYGRHANTSAKQLLGSPNVSNKTFTYTADQGPGRYMVTVEGLTNYEHGFSIGGWNPIMLEVENSIELQGLQYDMISARKAQVSRDNRGTNQYMVISYKMMNSGNPDVRFDTVPLNNGIATIDFLGNEAVYLKFNIQQDGNGPGVISNYENLLITPQDFESVSNIIGDAPGEKTINNIQTKMIEPVKVNGKVERGIRPIQGTEFFQLIDPTTAHIQWQAINNDEIMNVSFRYAYQSDFTERDQVAVKLGEAKMYFGGTEGVFVRLQKTNTIGENMGDPVIFPIGKADFIKAAHLPTIKLNTLTQYIGNILTKEQADNGGLKLAQKNSRISGVNFDMIGPRMGLFSRDLEDDQRIKLSYTLIGGKEYYPVTTVSKLIGGALVLFDGYENVLFKSQLVNESGEEIGEPIYTVLNNKDISAADDLQEYKAPIGQFLPLGRVENRLDTLDANKLGLTGDNFIEGLAVHLDSDTSALDTTQFLVKWVNDNKEIHKIKFSLENTSIAGSKRFSDLGTVDYKLGGTTLTLDKELDVGFYNVNASPVDVLGKIIGNTAFEGIEVEGIVLEGLKNQIIAKSIARISWDSKDHDTKIKASYRTGDKNVLISDDIDFKKGYFDVMLLDSKDITIILEIFDIYGLSLGETSLSISGNSIKKSHSLTEEYKKDGTLFEIQNHLLLDDETTSDETKDLDLFLKRIIKEDKNLIRTIYPKNQKKVNLFRDSLVIDPSVTHENVVSYEAVIRSQYSMESRISSFDPTDTWGQKLEPGVSFVKIIGVTNAGEKMLLDNFSVRVEGEQQTASVITKQVVEAVKKRLESYTTKEQFDIITKLDTKIMELERTDVHWRYKNKIFVKDLLRELKSSY